MLCTNGGPAAKPEKNKRNLGLRSQLLNISQIEEEDPIDPFDTTTTFHKD